MYAGLVTVTRYVGIMGHRVHGESPQARKQVAILLWRETLDPTVPILLETKAAFGFQIFAIHIVGIEQIVVDLDVAHLGGGVIARAHERSDIE